MRSGLSNPFTRKAIRGHLALAGQRHHQTMRGILRVLFVPLLFSSATVMNPPLIRFVGWRRCGMNSAPAFQGPVVGVVSVNNSGRGFCEWPADHVYLLPTGLGRDGGFLRLWHGELCGLQDFALGSEPVLLGLAIRATSSRPNLVGPLADPVEEIGVHPMLLVLKVGTHLDGCTTVNESLMG
jgi:hypothetical protein